ncbi:hypothetical protein CORC01_03661 [Colletotrichum orchidophilum]|uniref:Uncharacterized protein n=1 Tax=Colletotrichum orchidophilum TaxID=1209926 RepID=A0A1G4BI64_9PEZI|nr:uncharacterized protein CORC01_03661 [Colletotrichum orchidophilum]OHF01094.1 hypothetical protein CORC01_03661 [Colletotrichum orchidophilum]
MGSDWVDLSRSNLGHAILEIDSLMDRIGRVATRTSKVVDYSSPGLPPADDLKRNGQLQRGNGGAFVLPRTDGNVVVGLQGGVGMK